MILLSFTLLLTTIVTLFKGINNECWPSEIVLGDTKTSSYTLGPSELLTIDGDIPKDSGKFFLNFWMEFTDDSAIPDEKELTVLRLGTVSTATTNPLYMEVRVLRTSSTDWKLWFYNEQDDIVWGASMNMYNHRRWWFISLGHDNDSLEESMRVVAHDTVDKTVTLVASESWDFDAFNLRIFANASLVTEYFSGSIGKIDLIAGMYDLNDNKYSKFSVGLPRIIYLIDFTDPEYTQYFANRMPDSGYSDAIRGLDNHTDYGDLPFNPVNEFAQRHVIHFITLPFFKDREFTRQSMIYHMKLRGWALNHWSRGSEYYWNFARWTSSNGLRHGFKIYKVDYSSRLRIYMTYGHTRHCCNYYVESDKANHEAYTTNYGFIVHLYGPDHITYRSYYSFGCNGYLSDYMYSTSKISNSDTDTYKIGKRYDQDYNFPDRPYRFESQDMQTEVGLQLFILMEDGYRSNPSSKFPSVCNDNSLEEYGTGLDSFRGTCQTGYTPYHEVNECIQDPVSEDFIDCAHDMDSVGSICHRCKRYYGHTGTEGCFRCADNCITCTGPASDQCTYCGMGYGFTGTSCKICSDDEAWDLSTNLCQSKKVRFMEADFGYRTFGKIKLIFNPLDGEADLTLYEEQMWKKFWLNDINRQYYLIRNYTDLPLHRKISISFEFQIIDTRTYRYFYAAIDGDYIWDFSPNCEDETYGIQNSYWNYGYLDMPPYKVSFTRFHSADNMEFGIVGFWSADWTTVWVREVNATFFGCYEACATCWEDNSPVHCITCLPGYYLVVSECKACHSNCATCVGTATQCTSCPDSQFLKGSECAVTCGLGYYADSSNVCQPCPTECVQCNSLTSCNSCKNGYYLNVASCDPCGSNCVTCTSSATKCLSCEDPTPKLKDFACVTDCGTGYYEVAGDICNPCPPGCTTCTSTDCLTCDTGYKKKNNICANPCGDGWYDAGTDCQQCDSQCATCDGSSSNCSTCAEGRAQTPSSCPPCSAPCTTCSSSTTTCTSCSGAFYLTGTSCVASTDCPSGTYPNNNVCEPCTAPCATCSGSATNCLSCSTGVLFNNACPATCPTGYSIYSGTTCCPESCSACSDINTCSACNNGYYLSGSSCLACDSNCATCETTSTNCLTCPTGKLLQGSKCLDECLDKFYPNGSVCAACDSTCATCTGPLATDCSTCITAHFFYAGICQDCTDSDNAYFTSINDKCWDKCGTGNRFTPTTLAGLSGYNACDDGNLINGDGCSSDCTIEKNFRCEGGSPTTPDKCYSKIKPQAELVKVYDDKFQIQFSKPVRFTDGTNEKTIADILGIEIEGFTNPDDYTFEIVGKKFDATDPDNADIVGAVGQADYDSSHTYYSYLNVTFKFSKTVPDNTKIYYTFNRTQMIDVNENSLKNQKISSRIGYTVTEHHAAESTLNLTSSTQVFTNTITPIASLGLTNYVVQSWIRSLSAIQTVTFTKFVDVDKTERLNYVVGGSFNKSMRGIKSPGGWFREQTGGEKWDKTGEVAPAPSDVITTRILQMGLDWTRKIFTEDKISYSESGNNRVLSSSTFASIFVANSTETNNQFSKSGYVNAMIPNLSFNVLVILFSGLWYFTSNVFIGRKVTVRSNCLMRFIAYGGERTLWVALMLSMLELSMFSTNNLLNPSFATTPQMVSTISAAITFIFLLSFPIFIFKLTNKHYTQMWNPEFYHRYAFFFCEFKLNKTSTKTFMSLVMARLILFGIIVAALQNKPFTQTFFLCVIQLIYFFLLMNFDPFVSKVMKILNIIMESALMFVFVCYSILGWDKSNGGRLPEGAKNTFADILVWGIVVVVLMAILSMLYMIVMKIWFTIKRCIDGGKIKGDQSVLEEDKKAIFDDSKEEEKKEEKQPEPEFDLEKEFMDGGLGKRRDEQGFEKNEDDLDLEAEFDMGEKKKEDIAMKQNNFEFDQGQGLTSMIRLTKLYISHHQV